MTAKLEVGDTVQLLSVPLDYTGSWLTHEIKSDAQGSYAMYNGERVPTIAL